MVVKPSTGVIYAACPFESRAVLDGSQTLSPMLLHRSAFESRAVLDGSQTSLSSTLFGC